MKELINLKNFEWPLLNELENVSSTEMNFLKLTCQIVAIELTITNESCAAANSLLLKHQMVLLIKWRDFLS